MNKIELRKTKHSDLDKLFEFQLDEDARRLAAFVAEDPTDKAAYFAKFTRLFVDPTVNNQTIFVNGIVVGSIAKFEIEGVPEITYWLDRQLWGQGIATAVIKTFLESEKARPILGRVAIDNFASRKVLERAGFIQIAADKGYSPARQNIVEEYIYQLL